jgi:hypothetical protein
MGALDYLTSQTNPAYGTSTNTSVANVPDWYSDYIKGIAGKGLELAGQNQDAAIPQQSIADMTPDQVAAFQQIRDNQGMWKPGLAQAGDTVQGALGTAQGAAGAANAAVAGPSQNWTDPGTQQSYMSPYTNSVVNEIARLGNQNFSENIMPQINASMIGSGQFGSTRNAGALSNAARDNEQNIMGQQASALESGYSTAGNLFNQDAGRAQQQQQMQASTALAGGTLGAQTGLAAGQQQGALAQTGAALGMQDAQAQQAIGQQQQQFSQTGLDTDYNNLVAQQQYGWNNLNNLNSIIRGAQLPTNQTSMTNGPLSRTPGQSPLTTLGQTYAGLAGS